MQNAPQIAALGSKLEIRVLKNDHRVLAAELETTEVRFFAAAAAIFLPVATEPVNMILSGAASTRAAPVRAVAGHDLNDVFRDTRLVKDLADLQSDKWRQL